MALEAGGEGNIIAELASSVRLPRMVKVKQPLNHSHIDVNEIPGIVHSELDREEPRARIKPGIGVAIACGSRGVTNITVIIRAIVDSVKECDGGPFIFPAMGSHGGATAQGQRKTLVSYHITENTMGCPVKAAVEVVQVGEAPDGMPVYVDRYAYEADAIILYGRVKAHTTPRGPYESGIMKMAVIDLGKQKGAEAIHRNGLCELGTMLPVIKKVVLGRAPVIGALALVENAFDQTCIIKGMLEEEIYGEGPKLLIVSRQRPGKVYLDNIDVLVVGRVGRDISGGGVDPNVAGRFAVPYINEGIRIQHVAVLGLTDETHGNCSGLRFAGITTKRLVDKIDVDCTCPNVVTSTMLCISRILLFTHSDRTCVQIALRTCNCVDCEHPRVVRIKDTMNLEGIYISESMLKETEESNHVVVSGPPKDWVFNEEGDLW